MAFPLMMFDFDGTLADTRGPIIAAKQETMRRLQLPVLDEEACASTIGLTAKLGFKQLYPDLPDERIAECVALYRALFDEIIEEKAPPLFPGVRETLQELLDRGHRLTIVTSRHNSSLYGFLEKLQLEPFFEYVLGGDDTARLKPYPDAVWKTLADLGVSAEDALVVGDMPFDIRMAKAAQVSACGVTYGNATEEMLLESGADYIIKDVRELLRL